MTKNKTFWDKFWRDKNGHDVIWQRPNMFLWTWIGCTVVGWFIPYGHLKEALGYIGFGAIVIWALLELTKGVNYFRRTLGLIVLLGTILNRIIH